MHRGGGLGEGTDDLGPRRARRGRHRREAAESTEARQAHGTPGEPDRLAGQADRLGAGSRNGGRVGVTYKYFGAPDGATAARVPISMRPEELGGDELGMNGMFTKIKPETMAAMVLTGIEGVPLHKVPPLELVVLHPDYAVVKLPMTVVDPCAASARRRSARRPSSGRRSRTGADRGTRSTCTSCCTSGRTSRTGCMRRGISRIAWCGPELGFCESRAGSSGLALLLAGEGPSGGRGTLVQPGH